MQVVNHASIAAALLILPMGAASAGDGRHEINQSSVTAAGDWPYTLSQPGSYVLTGDLAVPAGKPGLEIAADDVTLDLNGFGVRSTYVCDLDSCPAGSVIGIQAISTGVAIAARSTIVNGYVRGFDGDCVSLGPDARVDGTVVSSCGGDGIQAQERSILRENRISACREFGLNLSDPSSYASNMLAQNGLGGGLGGPVFGGTDAGGNLCDPASISECTSASGRRFYLTKLSYIGPDADNAGNCTTGFHFASFWEIYDTASLRYDVNLGMTRADSGEGMPSNSPGWIRTGFDSADFAVPGEGNCSVWSSTDNWGSLVHANEAWTSWTAANERWHASYAPCGASWPIWCVED